VSYGSLDLAQRGGDGHLLSQLNRVCELLVFEYGEVPTVSTGWEVDGTAGIEEEQRIKSSPRPQDLSAVRSSGKWSVCKLKRSRVIAENDQW
jgi:hypothetical protein